MSNPIDFVTTNQPLFPQFDEFWTKAAKFINTKYVITLSLFYYFNTPIFML
jgi:hypothetical protein